MSLKLVQYEAHMKMIHTAYTKLQYTLDLKFMGLGAKIDEIAIMLSEENLDDFVGWVTLMDDEVRHMGSVPRDRMNRLDGKPGEGFDVRFEFFQPKGKPYRIEAMAVLDGTAPLHMGRLDKIVHASYKPARAGNAQGFRRSLIFLDDIWGFHPLGHYQNSYGLFSYYSVEEFGPTYLKPRVNLRDRTSTENAPSVEEELAENKRSSEEN